jgi:hypothetical protein
MLKSVRIGYFKTIPYDCINNEMTEGNPNGLPSSIIVNTTPVLFDDHLT